MSKFECTCESATIALILDQIINSNTLELEKELIIVDDGSTDGTRELLKDLEVIGVITKDLLDIEIANKSIPRLCVVGSMHERKALMTDLSDGFIAMPGGFGTMEEFMEVVTWSQLGVHRKPCGLLNVNGYYDFLLNMCDHAVKEGFITTVDRRLIIADPEPQSLIDRLNKFDVPPPSKWMSMAET